MQIICALCCGRERRDTITLAIDVVMESGAILTFFHGMVVECLQFVTIGPIRMIYEELIEMCDFAMLILCDRAHRRGVANVDYIVREGNVRRQLRQLAIETQAEVIVMGQPTRSPTRNVFKLAELEQFVAELEQEGGVRIVQVTPSVLE